MFKEIEKIVTLGNDSLKISTGKLARNATSSVVVEMGDCFILCTVVISKEPLEKVDFVPLIVNYQEKTYAAGKIPGGFFKKEGKSSEREVLISRLIDRTVRPLLRNIRNEIQIICTVHSYDNRYNPDILSIIATSAALSLSGLDVEIFVAARIGYGNNNFVLNPSISDSDNSDLNMIVSLTEENILMLEADANFFSNEQILKAIKFAQESSEEMINAIKMLSQEFFTVHSSLRQEFVLTPNAENSSDLESIKSDIEPIITEILEEKFFIKNKKEKYSVIEEIKIKVKEYLNEKNIEHSDEELSELIVKIRAKILRKEILKRKTRIDGRKNDEVRQIESEIGILSSAHGSALFTRGETQSLTSVTLGTAGDSQSVSSLDDEYKENFLLEYIFPPYATADITSLRAPSRREIGHGKLAWKALKRTLPLFNDFPYTIRVVSEITESNGSSSMATVCAGSMALMSGGVNIKTPIAGVAMGVLISEEQDPMILSDINADEDHIGDMDCKITGTQDSITAIQMDLKVKGIKQNLIATILDKAKEARVTILNKMSNAIDTTHDLKESVPVIKYLNISNQDQVGKIIGPGGRTIKDISSTTNTNIEIIDKEQKILISGKLDDVEKALNRVNTIIKEFKLGQIIEGKIVKIIDSGVFVDLNAANDGFIHISEISEERISDIRVLMKEGDVVTAKIIDIDSKGKIRLTIKNLQKENINYLENKNSRKTSRNYNDRNRHGSPSGRKKFTSVVNNNNRNPQFKQNKIKRNPSSSNVERKYFY